MSDNKWEMIGVLFILFFYAIFVLCLHLCDNGHREKFYEIFSKIRTKFKIYYLIPILLFLFTVITYAIIMTSSPTEPNSACFGQLGYFFGGILNPIFGIITIIFLWTTLQKESEKNENEKRVREKHEINEHLERSLRNYNKDLKKKQFDINGTSESFLERYTDDNRKFTKNLDEYAYIRTIVIDVMANKLEGPHQSTYYDTNNPANDLINPLGYMLNSLINVREIYFEAIMLYENKKIKQSLIKEFSDWYRAQGYLNLITDEDYNQATADAQNLATQNNEHTQ